ncbi:hypothetical protein BGW38_008626 [Lunasporangiospora selenospora]|uniref:HTH APSES-type domain-containing protein n=1 Tax=Lunasporangiospora selenospora TaxID=979761 RepID=A0A9P6KJ01_9FUNG|nr:hypothetical protein BGW38_008626 [Lunasporangiospora selenospora]
MSGSSASTLVETSAETLSVTVQESVAIIDTVETTIVTSSITKGTSKADAGADAAPQRELPIFSNPLLANVTQGNSAPVKPKTGRVKSGSRTVVVLRINAPKVDGDVAVMRRMDTDLVNAVTMYNAAYPAVSEKMIAKESAFLARKFEGVVEKSGALSGVWITIAQAKELSKEYEIDQFMRPLLEAPNSKNPLNKDGSMVTEIDEVIETLLVSETTTVENTSTKVGQHQIQETTATNEDPSSKQLSLLTVSEVAGMKRRIEELEDQTAKDKKRLRGLLTVAVGFAAASVIPQVLPYFS